MSLTPRQSPASFAQCLRSPLRLRALAALTATLPLLNIQCGDEARQQFKREFFPAVTDGLQSFVSGAPADTSLQTILNGAIDGLFQMEEKDLRFGTDGGAD